MTCARSLTKRFLVLTPCASRDSNLLEQDLRVNDNAVADETDLIGVEDAGRHHVKPEDTLVGDHGVTGVVPRRVAHHYGGVAGQEVHHAPLALVAPLTAYDDNDRHE